VTRAIIAAVTAAALAAGAACGARAGGGAMPGLPGDGDTNTARPRDRGAAAPDPWAGRTDLIATPAPQPPAEVKLPAIQRFTLGNGLRVIVVENHDLPVIGMSLAIRAGRADEPRDKVGISGFAAAMLTEGTRRRSAERIAEEIDGVGGSLGATATFEATLVKCSALSADARVCMELLPDVVSAPAFPDKGIAETRGQLLATVAQRRDDPDQLAGAHFQNLLWGDDHARGWVTSARSVQAIQRADLVAWQRAWYRPNNAILAVAGDVDAKRLRRDLERSFGRWRRGPVPARPGYEEPKIDGARVRLVDKPDQTQSQVRVGHLGLRHGDPDFYAAMVVNHALGGGEFASRLMRQLRSEGGKTYGATSAFDINATRGAFVVSTFTRSAETAATVKTLLGVIRQLKEAGPTEGEVADAKTNLAGRYALRFESAADVAGALVSAELHGLDDAYVRGYPVRVGAVTVDDARKTAAARLDADNLVIVIVGAAREVEPQLQALGLRYDKVAASDPIGGAGADAAAAGTALVPVADPKAVAAARKVLAAALAAKGGADRLRAVTTLRLSGRAKIESPQGNIDADVVRIWKQGKIRIDMKIPAFGVEIRIAASPAGGWTRQAQGEQARVIDLARNDVEGQLWRNAEFVLLQAADATSLVRPLPDEKVGGAACHVISFARADGKFPTRLYVNKRTKMLERMVYEEEGVEAVETFADYRSVEGVQIAHKRGGKAQEASELTVTAVEINQPVADDIFAKPAK
jgi:zinc protease